MEYQETKTPRKRVANFTAHEKALLAKLIKSQPIVESKATDGKSVVKKNAAWALITKEFNSNSNVHKRETITLKRAWDNMKAVIRKSYATERPNVPPLSPQPGPILSMAKEVPPMTMSEINNPHDSDSTTLNTVKNNKEEEVLEDFDNLDYSNSKKNALPKESTNRTRRPMDYIRREAVMRIKHLEIKKKLDIEILKTQLEVEQIKKKSALLEEERNKCLLEKTKIELEELKKLLAK
ncbi:hypothetical protein HW555_003294 [Spodoptera exigua]|uniref:Regulatory protein zeste n=1 Tax=Spodoptera exigua TaxID=7107 RepID=A0A835GQI5_SPOEX|nr:hypothetical protein HW555_003294 [Spodoptera exigua]